MGSWAAAQTICWGKKTPQQIARTKIHINSSTIKAVSALLYEFLSAPHYV